MRLTFFKQFVWTCWLNCPVFANRRHWPGGSFRVTRNKCFHRKRETQRHSMQEIGDDESPGSEESADNLVSEFQQYQLLREALSELPPSSRRLVQMLFFETPARPP